MGCSESTPKGGKITGGCCATDQKGRRSEQKIKSDNFRKYSLHFIVCLVLYTYILRDEDENMSVFFRKSSKIFAGVLSAVLQVANLFIGNIIVYESTEKVRFDWMLLLKNWLFWLILVITIIYYAIAKAIKQQDNDTDDNIEAAISNNSVRLLDLATRYAQTGNYELSKKAMKLFDSMQKRRKK